MQLPAVSLHLVVANLVKQTEMKNHKLILSVSAAVLLFGSAACRPDNPVPDPDPTENYVWIEPNIERTGAHVALLEKQDDGSYLIELPTSDPYIYFFPFEEDLPGENTVLAFEYKAENAIDRTQCFFIDAEEGLNAAHAQDGPGAAATDTWTPYSVRMKTAMAEFSWGEEGDYLRLDLGESIVPGSTIRLRNICIRPMNASEQAEQDKEDDAAGEKDRYAQGILDYLDRDYASAIGSVSVGADKVSVSGTVSGEGTFFLAEIPVFEDIFSMTVVPEQYRHELGSSSFMVELDRIASYGGMDYDRLLSRWAVFREGDGSDELVSHAAYADPDLIYNIGPGLPRIELRNKKGLGGIVPRGGMLEQEIADLNLSSATINLLPLSYMSLTPGGDYTVAHEYLGKTYYFNGARIEAEIDEPLRIASRHGVSVAAILLIQNAAQSADPSLGALMQHPDYSGTLYTMPDMTTPESVHAYAAMIDFFASRYSASDMRISHWIIHNEIDGGVHWTNMGGDVPLATYMDTYLKSMRLVYNIAHQYDPNAEAFVSLAHGWTEEAGGGWYKVTDILDMMNRYSRAEGDFFWAPAYHSYGVAISDPRIWLDENVSYSMQSPNVSMRNLEVLDRWVKTPENMYRGEIMRKVWLSEAGVGSGNTNDPYDDKTLSDQAAGFAYSWLKIQALDGIEGLQWHNWFDSMEEGAKLGLRKYDDGTFNGEAKPVWYAYQKAGETDQDEYFDSQGYAETVGSDWGVIHEVTD